MTPWNDEGCHRRRSSEMRPQGGTPVDKPYDGEEAVDEAARLRVAAPTIEAVGA